MKIGNIQLGEDVVVDVTTLINNVVIGDRVKIAKYCSIFGSPDNLLEIGTETYIGMFSIVNGFADKVIIGDNVSIAQKVNIMADSGPNASPMMQKYYPIIVNRVKIGNHSWIGTNATIMPGVELGEFCIVAANSFVTESFPAYSLIGGCPAKLIKKII
jgi:acetyltransferase-like isoleucine patch superfamily enzyme